MSATASRSHLGVDIGGTRTKWSLVDDAGRTYRAGEVATPKAGGADVVDLVVDIAEREGTAADTVGVAVPGLVNSRSHELLLLPNIPGSWEGFPLGAQLSGKLGKRVAVLNDARAFGYAELLAGAGRGHADVLFMTVGTGVGGAIAREGRIRIDEVDAVPEVGHMVVELDGERCACGASGCLETVASASAVVSRGARALLTGQSPTLTSLCEGRIQNLTAEVVAQAADAGDAFAQALFERVGGHLGMAAASASLILQPTAVVVGGGLAGAFRHFGPAMRRLLADRAPLLGDVDLQPGEIGPQAGSVGAALYARDRFDGQHDRHDQLDQTGQEAPHGLD